VGHHVDRRGKISHVEWAAVVNDAAAVARGIVKDRERYEQAGAQIEHLELWPLIGAIHNREASRSFSTHLHNGDSLKGYTRHVPADRPQVGHGPPFSWEESAQDALRLKGWDKIAEWPLERWLYEAERYNGWGYLGRINSPYIWAGTSKQQRGKFYADGKYSASIWDTQLGIAAILKAVFDFVPNAEPLSDVAPEPPVPDVSPVGTSDFIKYIEREYVILTKKQFAMLLEAIKGAKK
jgi:lysozyme family protein